jgi:hypothetical protein
MEGVIRNKDYDGRSMVGVVKAWLEHGARPWWIDSMSLQGWCRQRLLRQPALGQQSVRERISICTKE